MPPSQTIRERPPAERVAYVEGFAAGWKQALAECQIDHEAALLRLDEILDLMSAVENHVRGQGR